MQVNGNPLRALAQWYALTGDENSRNLAEKLSRFMLKPGQWGGNTEGPTMVDISPRPEEFNWKKISSDDGTWTELNKEMGYPMYQREHMKASEAPMTKVTRYVHQF